MLRPVRAATDPSEPITNAVVILHRLTLDEKKLSLLRARNVSVIQTRSVTATLSALSEAREPRIVITDMSIGSDAPEKLARGIAAAPLDRAGRKPTMICCTTKQAGRVLGRASRLGATQVFVWPEGAFAELVRTLAPEPGFALRRTAERAVLGEEFESLDDDVSGRILNISSTGALIECSAGAADVTMFALDLELPGTGIKTEVTARVAWSENVGDRVQLGLEFVRVSPTIRAAIAAFVHEQNVLTPPPRQPHDETQKPTPPSQRQKARVQRAGDSRVDYFYFEGDPAKGGLLVPKVGYFVPFRPGDELTIQLTTSAGPKLLRAPIIDSVTLDPGRVNSRIGWRLGPSLNEHDRDRAGPP
jgi:hypothetical protein